IRLMPGKGAHAYADRKTLYIGRSYSLSDKISALAHEAYHLLYGRTPIPQVAVLRMSRERYVRMSLQEETDCVLHALQVISELKAAGYKISPDEMTYYRRYRRGGR